MIKETLLGEEYKFRDDNIPYELSLGQKKARQCFLDEINKASCYRVIEKCPFCGKEYFNKISEIDAKGLPCDVVLCNYCDGCFKVRVLSAQANKYHYENISYALRGKSSTAESMQKLFDTRVKLFAYPRYYFIRNFITMDPSQDLIAEIGCNDGANLVPWRDNGFSVCGIELDKNLVELGSAKGLWLEQTDFLKKSFGARKPRLIIISHLIEHVEDINDLMNWLVRELAPDGYIFIETPGVRAQGLGRPLKYFDVEHNYYLDLKSLERLMRKHAFNTLYCDEFIRFLALAPQASNLMPKKALNFTSDIFLANLAGVLKKIVNFDKAGLLSMMRSCEKGGFQVKLANKFVSFYFNNFYSAVVKIGRKKYEIKK